MEALPWISAIVIARSSAAAVIAATGAKHGIKAEVKKAEIEAMKTYADATTALTEKSRVDRRAPRQDREDPHRNPVRLLARTTKAPGEYRRGPSCVERVD